MIFSSPFPSQCIYLLPQNPFMFSPSTSSFTQGISLKPEYIEKNRRKTTRNFRPFKRKYQFLEFQFEDSDEVSPSQEVPVVTSFDKQVVSGIPPTLLARWLRSSSSVKDVRRLHVLFLKRLASSVTYVGNNLMSSYLRFGELLNARKVFGQMRERSVVSWTAIINGYLSFGLNDGAFMLFKDSINHGVQGNGKMFVCVLNLCSKRLDFDLGRQVHCCIVKGNWRNLIIDSAIIYFYAQCGELSSAFLAFEQMPKRDVISWTSMVTACSQQGCEEEAFSMFSKMLSAECYPNEYTVCSVLKACGEDKELRFGRQLHCIIAKAMVKSDVFIGTSLVDMYAKCGEVSDSRKVFNRMRNRNTVTWTSIISGYARDGLGEEAISLFRLMKKRNIFVNDSTVVSVLRACGSIGATLMGKEVHTQIVKNSIEGNVHIGSTLVWFYCKCGKYFSASMVLQQMPFRDVVPWTAIISGCTDLGLESEALRFLNEMIKEGVEPNSYTYSSALKACAKTEAIFPGKSIHSAANKTFASCNVYVNSALIYMYGKCGYVEEAFRVFEGMPERNLVSWKAMILSYARNGLCKDALKLLYRMRAEGIEVDDYVLASVYSACGEVGCDLEPLADAEYDLQSR